MESDIDTDNNAVLKPQYNVVWSLNPEARKEQWWSPPEDAVSSSSRMRFLDLGRTEKLLLVERNAKLYCYDISNQENPHLRWVKHGIREVI